MELRATRFGEFAAFLQHGGHDLETIRQKRQAIQGRILAQSEVLEEPDFRSICQQDLFEMFRACDEMFFENRLLPFFESREARLRFRFSKRMTKTGGQTTYRKLIEGKREVRDFEIAISATLLFNTRFSSGNIRVAGVSVESRLDAMQRILEHELVHLSEMILWDDSSCARRRFRTIANNLFGHRESNHQLVTPAESARKEFNLDIGDPVEFRFEGKKLAGYVNRISRRVTVLVPDAKGEQFDDGKRYKRFYVPTGLLSRNSAMNQ